MKNHPGKFYVILQKEGKKTGNLEVKLVEKGKAEKGVTKKEVLVHTRLGGQGFPSVNWETFNIRLANAMNKI